MIWVVVSALALTCYVGWRKYIVFKARKDVVDEIDKQSEEDVEELKNYVEQVHEETENMSEDDRRHYNDKWS